MNHLRISNTISNITLHGYALVALSFAGVASAEEEKKNTGRAAIVTQPVIIDCVANAGKDTALCTHGASLSIGGSPSASEGTPPYTYGWFPAAGLDYVDKPNPIATPTVTTDYILTITDANNIQARDTVKVIVDPLVAPVIKALKPTTFYTGEFTILDAGSGYTSYQWSNGTNTQKLTVSEAGKYFVTTSNGGACRATSDTVEVIVKYPSVKISGPDRIACGQSASFFVSVAPQPSKIYWSVRGMYGDIQFSGQGSSGISFWGGASGFSVYVTCEFAATGNFLSDGRFVAIDARPISITAKSGLECEGDSIVLSTSGFPGSVTCRWSTGEIAPSITVKSSGSYWATPVDLQPCFTTSDTRVILFNPPPPKPTITQRADTLFSTAAESYQWKRYNKILPNETKQFLVLKRTGDYSVTINDKKSCSSVSDDFDVTSTGVDEPFQSASINIYPNPTDDDIQIEVPFSGVECRISTVLGMTVVKQVLEWGKTSISLSDFPAGIYCVELTSGSRRFVRMITKQ